MVVAQADFLIVEQGTKLVSCKGLQYEIFNAGLGLSGRKRGRR